MFLQITCLKDLSSDFFASVSLKKDCLAIHGRPYQPIFFRQTINLFFNYVSANRRRLGTFFLNVTTRVCRSIFAPLSMKYNTLPRFKKYTCHFVQVHQDLGVQLQHFTSEARTHHSQLK